MSERINNVQVFWVGVLKKVLVMTSLGKQFIKTRMTVRLFVMLLKDAFVQWFQTERTGKVFRVVFLKHCGDATALDWLAAYYTQCATLVMVMGCAIRLAFKIEIPFAIDEWGVAILEKKKIVKN